jgi:hypothetical protein
VEIRLLRGLRADRAAGNRAAIDRPGGFRDSLMVLVRRTIGRLEAEHADPNYIAAAGVAWTPSRRDIGDYLTSFRICRRDTKRLCTRSFVTLGVAHAERPAPDPGGPF